MVKEKPVLSVFGVSQSESKSSSTAQNEDPPPVSSSSSQQHQRAKSPGMSALKDSSASKNRPMDQNSSKSPSHGVAQHMAKTHNNNNNSSSNSSHRDADRVVSLVNDFQSLVPSPGSAHQQALQQQALHQQALHQQSLKQHGIQPVGFQAPLQPSRPRQAKQTSQQNQQDKCIKAEPMDAYEFLNLDKSRTMQEMIEIDDGKGKEGAREHDHGRRHAQGGNDCMQVQSQSTLRTTASREAVFADLNAEPPMSDGEEPSKSEGTKIAAQTECSRSTSDEKKKKKNSKKVKNIVKDIDEERKKIGKPSKARSKSKRGESTLESGHETDADQQYLDASESHEEKIKSLKVGLVHAARKMPKNAHAHFILGLMYQRLGQPMKAVVEFQKSTEILKQSEEESGQSRPQLLSLVQIHHAQCLLQGKIGEHCIPDKGLQDEEIHDIVCKLNESVQVDNQQASVWNTLGLLLLKTGHVQSSISILSSLLSVAPDNLDALANLGVAYLHSGELEYAARCFQALLMKDKHHSGVLINYGALLLCKYGSVVAGSGARGGQGAYATQIAAASAAQQCFAAALKADPKGGHIWVNLASAYSLAGDHISASRCLEQASKLEPNRMSIRYAVAINRVKDAERSQDPTQQLSWAANEMASILREGDPAIVQPCIAWAGLAMVDKARHETAAAFEGGETDLKEVEERALYTLQQAIEEDPDDAVQWHQLGLHTLCTLQFKDAQSYLKTAIARRKGCSSAWSNLGIALQLSEDLSLAEDVYKRALSLATSEQAHSVLSNLGNLYRQQKRFVDAHQAFAKALEICPSYAPACNNLGLLYIVEGRWQEAIACFDQALLADPLLDAAKSNKMKAVALSPSGMNGDSPMSPTILNSPETPLDLQPSSSVLTDATHVISEHNVNSMELAFKTE